MALMRLVPEIKQTYESVLVEANSSSRRPQVTGGSERPIVKSVHWEDGIFPESSEAGEHVSALKKSVEPENLIVLFVRNPITKDIPRISMMTRIQKVRMHTCISSVVRILMYLACFFAFFDTTP